jgi:endonuclease/exonuclease/phosphatase family metal-dependent hydrolase
MKIIFVIVSLLIGINMMAQEMTVMTYNIRYDNPGDKENRWDNRKEALTDQIQFYEPLVFGVQEAQKHQMNYMDSILMDYTYVGVGRDDGKEGGEYSAIFYRSSELDTLMTGTFWLSDNPTRPSKGWDAAFPRVCTYARFSYQKNEFWVFNTHFDHKGSKAREESARLILRQIRRLNNDNYPVILMGDFNANDNEAPIQVIEQMLQDSRKTAELFYGPETTFNGFSLDYDPSNRIDYVFHSSEIIVQRKAILAQLIEKRFPSDHFPVIVNIRLEN